MDQDIQQILSEVAPDSGNTGNGWGSNESNETASTPAPSSTPAPEQKPQETAKEQAAREWLLNVNGKQIKTTDEQKMIQWAQQGYNYAQSMEMLKKEKEELSNKYKGYDRYSEIDQYAKQNPDWWQQVEQSYAQRLQDPQNQTQSQFEKLLNERLGPISEFISELQNQKKDYESQQADSALRGEIESISKDYPEVDLFRADESGKTLEMKVIEHAQQRGIPSFTAAFRDYYFQDLIKLERARAQEEATKKIQAQRKNGIVSQSSTPTKKGEFSYNPRASYNDQVHEALSELGFR